MKTFKLEARYVPYFEGKIEKLNKVARKLGCEQIFVFIGKPFTEDIIDRFGTKTKMTFQNVEFSGEAPGIPGFEFIGTIQHEEKGNILRMIPGEELSKDEDKRYRNVAADCDHCGMNRKRTDTYLIRDEKGSLRQVGKSCLKDFTGHNSPEYYAKMAELLSEFEDELTREFENDFASIPKVGILTTEYVAYVATHVRKFGFASKSQSYDRTPTSYSVWAALISPPKSEDKREYLAEIQPEAEDISMANRALEWVRNAESDNSYIQNLKVACSLESVSDRNIGFVASLISAYQRELSYQEKAKRKSEDKAKSEWIGEIGDKIEVPVILEAIHYSEGDYGLTIIYKLNSEGNLITWFSSRSKGWEVGDEFTLCGTVKKHDEFCGTKQTILTRCKAK